MNLTLQIDAAHVQPVVLFSNRPAQVYMLRLDKIHPVVSGNKWFKLKEWLDIAISTKKEGLFTAGGAFSNHIVAVAYAARAIGLSSAAIIRGGPGHFESQALLDAQEFGMNLQYMDRTRFRQFANDPVQSGLVPENWLAIPAGGEGPAGIKGTETILSLVPNLETYTHIICAVGTGTMLQGLMNAALPHQQVLGVSSLKGMVGQNIIGNYHFGGYGRYTQELLDIMNQVYRKNEIPTDFVYTGKLIFAIQDLISKNHFGATDRILAIHSGGLQGNRSLKKDQLIFL